MKIVKWFFSGEVMFAGFLTGYLLTPLTDGLIVFSHLFMALSIISLLYRWYKRGGITLNKISVLAFFIMILFLMVLSLSYTPDTEFGRSKVFLFSTLTAWSFLGTVLLIDNKKSLIKLLQGMILFTSLTAFFMVNTLTEDSYYGMGIGGAQNVIGVARLSGLGVILVVGLYFYQNSKGYKKALSFLLLFLLTASLLTTGSRGPLVAVVLSLLFFIPLSFKFSIKNLTIQYNRGVTSVFAIFAVMAIFIPVLINRGYFETILKRINTLLTANSGGESISERFSRFDSALNMFLESPILGKGVGSFSYYYHDNDSGGYAHNIFLEFMSELGLIGLIILLSLLLYTLIVFIKYSRKNKLNVYQTIIFICAAYLLLNANISADVNGNRLLFTFLALTIMIPNYSDLESERTRIS